jgi:hypothetical protein
MDNINQAILQHLTTDKWKHVKTLAKELDLPLKKDYRDLRKLITKMQQKGAWILSSDNGYRIAKNLDEIKETRDHYLKFIIGYGSKIKALNKMEKNFNGQIPLDL